MKITVLNMPQVKRLPEASQRPWISALKLQVDGSLLCGICFGGPALLRLHPNKAGEIERAEDLSDEIGFDSDVVGVLGGLRPSMSGDTVFSLLHSGSLPGFLRKMSGKNFLALSGEELEENLKGQEGGMGFSARHSIVEMSPDKISVRRLKEPGVLWDVARVGVHIYGLSGSSFWKEPYMNTEKRESLRSGLAFSGALHRDVEGQFWVAGTEGRLFRMGMSDIRPKATPLKIPGEQGLKDSSVSFTDGWLYLLSEKGTHLMRIRMNPESREEEIQILAEGRNFDALIAVDHPSVRKVFLFERKEEGGMLIKSIPLVEPEDAEALPAIPQWKDEGGIAELNSVNSLTVTAAPEMLQDELDDSEDDDASRKGPRSHKIIADTLEDPVMWCGEGVYGSDENFARIVRIDKF